MPSLLGGRRMAGATKVRMNDFFTYDSCLLSPVSTARARGPNHSGMIRVPFLEWVPETVHDPPPTQPGGGGNVDGYRL